MKNHVLESELIIGQWYAFTYKGHKLIYQTRGQYLGPYTVYGDPKWKNWLEDLEGELIEVPYDDGNYLDIVELELEDLL